MTETKKNATIHAFTCKASRDSKEQKAFQVEVEWKNASPAQIRGIAGRQIVVDVQAEIRKDWGSYENGHIFKVDAASYARGEGAIDVQAMLEHIASTDPERLLALIKAAKLK